MSFLDAVVTAESLRIDALERLAAAKVAARPVLAALVELARRSTAAVERTPAALPYFGERFADNWTTAVERLNAVRAEDLDWLGAALDELNAALGDGADVRFASKAGEIVAFLAGDTDGNEA